MSTEKTIEKLIEDTLTESLRTKKSFWEQESKKLLAAGELLYQVVQNENKVMIFGNGGSACDALHFSGEWINRFSKDRRPLPCIALTADTPLITCIGNDYSFDDIFERQVLGLGLKGDVAIGITTSGNSKNVIKALAAARSKGVTTLALLGGTGGKILSEKLADHVLLVSASNTTARIQETHEWILHSLCEYVDFRLANP